MKLKVRTINQKYYICIPKKCSKEQVLELMKKMRPFGRVEKIILDEWEEKK